MAIAEKLGPIALGPANAPYAGVPLTFMHFSG
jgi:hypothetical protein